MKLFHKLLEPIKFYDPNNNSLLYKLKTKLFTRLNLKEIKKNFNDFNEYYIVVSSENIYNEVREAIPIRDYTVLLRSIQTSEFNRDSFLKRKEKMDWVYEDNFLEKTWGWKLVYAGIKEESNKKIAYLVMSYYYIDSMDKKSKTKLIEYQRNFNDKLSDFDWKITSFNLVKV